MNKLNIKYLAYLGIVIVCLLSTITLFAIDQKLGGCVLSILSLLFALELSMEEPESIR